MDWLPLLFRWFHILGAAVMVGGLIFLRVSYVPARLAARRRNGTTESLPAVPGVEGSAPVAGEDMTDQGVRRSWGMAVGIASLALLVSGIYNTVIYAQVYSLPRWYHMAVGIKLVLGLLVMTLAALLAGRSPVARRWQTREKTWLTVGVVLAVALTMLAGTMNFGRMGSTLKPDARPMTPAEELGRSTPSRPSVFEDGRFASPPADPAAVESSSPPTVETPPSGD